MYAPRQPNARPALEQDAGRVSYASLTDDIGVSGAATAPGSSPPDRLPRSPPGDVPPAGRAAVAAGS
jgi:hypothetical protein